MPIKIVYDQWKLANPTKAQDIKSLMRRDASWGTHIKDLAAAAGTLSKETLQRCQTLEPGLTNDITGAAADQRFTLEFPDSAFDFQSEGVDHFVGTVAGDILRTAGIDDIQVKDFEVTSPALLKALPGPNVGIDGLYNSLLKNSLTGVQRPIIAFTVKPRIGLNVDEYVAVYTEAAKAGIDIIEDDERLVNPANCKFEDRVVKLAQAQQKYGGVYSPNITADSATALEKLEYCSKHDIRMVKFDVLVSGFETLRKLALAIRDKYSKPIAITVYPDAFDVYRKLGRDFILHLSRLCGADIIYAGSPAWSRFAVESGQLKDAIDPVFQRHGLLSRAEGTMKATLPTVTNDQHPSRAEAVIVYFRKYKNNHFRYAFFVGGGISGFPAGSIKEAAGVWLDCVKHAATTPLKGYKAYDFNKYHDAMQSIGWSPLDVEKAIK